MGFKKELEKGRSLTDVVNKLSQAKPSRAVSFPKFNALQKTRHRYTLGGAFLTKKSGLYKHLVKFAINEASLFLTNYLEDEGYERGNMEIVFPKNEEEIVPCTEETVKFNVLDTFGAFHGNKKKRGFLYMNGGHIELDGNPYIFLSRSTTPIRQFSSAVDEYLHECLGPATNKVESHLEGTLKSQEDFNKAREILRAVDEAVVHSTTHHWLEYMDRKYNGLDFEKDRWKIPIGRYRFVQELIDKNDPKIISQYLDKPIEFSKEFLQRNGIE